MIKQHLNYRIPDEIDAPLWRYFSLDKFKSLVETKSLYFARSDLLGDDHEGSTSEPSIKHRSKFYSGASKHFIEKGVVQIAKDWALCTFVSCWHNNTDESVAMWKLYTPEGEGVAVQAKLSSLKKSIQETEKEFCLGFVKYIDYDNDYISEANAFSPFFHKRSIYAHECEFRILTNRLEDIGAIQAKTKKPEKGVFVPVDVSVLIEGIIISPYATRSFFQQTTKFLKDNELGGKVKDSSTRRKPGF